jgi:hypothetical protein
MNRSLNQRHHDEHVHQAKQVAGFLRDNPEINLHRTASSKLPGDAMSLRGIPALARGVGGAINGTRPDSILNR